MGLFGSLFTGVSALFAQSQATAIVSNNIANVNTIGYKGSEASFNSLVTTESLLSQYSPGTVSVSRTQLVDRQGSIQQTSSGTDASISGNGFFPVKRSTDFGQEFLYTRAGQFSEDSTGLLTNAAGYALYAWPIDSSGNLPANQGDLDSLEPADVAFLGGLTRPTTDAEIALNLDADEDIYDPATFATAGTLPIDSQVAHFSRGLTIYDSLGTAQTITMEFRHIIGPMAHATSSASIALEQDDLLAGNAGAATSGGVLNGINDGDRATIQIGSGSVTVEFNDDTAVTTPTNVGDTVVHSLRDLLDAIESTGTAEARLTSTGQIQIQATDPTDNITFTELTGTPLSGATALNFIQDQVTNGTPYVYEPEYDITTATAVDPYVAQDEFPTFAETTAPNTRGWWEMTLVHPDGTNLSQGLINFNGDGSVNATADSEGNVDIELTNVDWGNGSSLQDFNLDVERFSQFAGNYDVISSDQNGAELGLRTGIELTREGKIVARFSNGASADLYQIPLVTFSNQNGLTEVSGTAYTETEESGEENLRESGSGGAGFVEPSTLEASNVDLADEFAKLIVSQRAFGAATRTITTVDQMTEDLLRLR